MVMELGMLDCELGTECHERRLCAFRQIFEYARIVLVFLQEVDDGSIRVISSAEFLNARCQILMLRNSNRKQTEYGQCSFRVLARIADQVYGRRCQTIRRLLQRRSLAWEWKVNGELRPLPNHGVHGNASAQRLHQPLGDGQAQSGATVQIVNPRPSLLERFEDLLEVGHFDALAMIQHGESDDAAGIRMHHGRRFRILQDGDAEFDQAVDLGELDGVAEQIVQNLLQPPAVHVHVLRQ
mmetsp:Transcript_1924/g.4736  ORF Transcript_1924/g.4736 Transcript_1924/m.4736 type:complete len:239 (+) Transcript_1924:1358-2074(+)